MSHTNRIQRIMKQVWRYFIASLRFLLYPIFRLIYQAWHLLKLRFSKYLEPAHNPILYSLTRKEFTLVAVLLVVALVVTDNLAIASKDTGELGQSSLLYQLYSEGDEELFVETGFMAPMVEENTIFQNTLADRDNIISAEHGFELGEAVLETEASALVAAATFATAASTADREKLEEYEVQSGDSIYLIARNFSLNLNTLLWANNLNENSVIRPGQTLKIPPTNGVLHTVASGDTIASIASKYQANAEDIVAFNKLNGSQIREGESLMVPGGIRPQPVAAPVTSSYASAGLSSGSANFYSFLAQDGGTDAGANLSWPAGSRGITTGYSYSHRAIDIVGPYGTPIYAADDGVVIRVAHSGYNGGYGKVVVVQHPNGMKTLYAHNSNIIVAVGQEVLRGQQIAEMGSTGRSTGNHVHFEVIVNGNRVNPWNYL